MAFGFMKPTVRRVLNGKLATISVLAALLFSFLQIPEYEPLETPEIRMNQFDGGGSLEERCGSITFEDIFLYSQAIFEVKINDDWRSADVDARAWINWTLADEIRKDLDSFLDGIIPSGGDGWLSTDEIELMVSIAADCLEYSITRIGIRDGPAHRGGVGVYWGNTSWENDQTNIGHFNGVPTRHSEGRDCQGFGQECFEVPVIPSIERDCDLDVNQSYAEDECRVELWLNASMVIDEIFDPNNFTISFNSSNMSNARLEFTFPQIPDLRMDMWEECEGRFVGGNMDGHEIIPTPVRGSCIGDGTASYQLRTNDDGSLTYLLDSNFSREKWPSGEDVFADFTTSPEPVDEAPKWTEESPANGSWFPVYQEGQTRLAEWNQVSLWFEDEAGVSNLEVLCNSTEGQVSQGIDGSLWINIEGVAQITCEAIDEAGKSSGNKTWNVGVPVTISSNESILTQPHPILLSHSPDWLENTVIRLSLIQESNVKDECQENVNSPSEEACYFGFFKGESLEQVVMLSSTGIVPGPVNLWIEVIVGNNSFQRVVDLGIVKISSPPTLTIGEVIFDGSLVKLDGFYSDPDGEDVEVDISMNGEKMGQISLSGNSWSSDWIDLSSLNSGVLNFEVRGCDQSGKCTSIFQDINNSEVILELMPDEELEEGVAGNNVPFIGAQQIVIILMIVVIFMRSGGKK